LACWSTEYRTHPALTITRQATHVHHKLPEPNREIGESASARGFIYFHASLDVDAAKTGPAPGAWGFKDLCWQRRVDAEQWQRARGFDALPDEASTHFGSIMPTMHGVTLNIEKRKLR
jgi:hypothetical protein